MWFAEDVFRWTKGLATFAAALVALWRSIVYIDPNGQYPAFASVFCGLFALCLMITGLSIVTQTRDAAENEAW